MRILILGGTRFVGLHFVLEALVRGHHVDTFHRGRSATPEGATALLGDRDGDLSALDAGRWDVVIDVSGYLPRQVRAAASRLRERAERYLFISSCSVYASVDAPGRDVGSPLRTLDDPTTETIDAASYGGLKVLCEREAEAAFTDRSLAIRPTYVVGPGDTTDRFTYWLRRVRRGGTFAAPIDPELPLAFVDVRDLARFTIDQAEGDSVGAVNVSGPAQPTTWGAVLREVAGVTGSDARPAWVPLERLDALGLPRSGLPMVTPFPFRGAEPYATASAVALGLRFTPVADTARDTLAWHDGHGNGRAGLEPDDEHRLLAVSGPPGV
jgi:2'-hydroxyisoflavone reductase